MTFSDLSSSQLERFIVLLEEKERLEKKLLRVSKALIEFVGGDIKGKLRGRRGRGSMKARILKELGKAGKAGAIVKDLAKAIKASPASVSVWFSTSGKKIKGVKKLGRGRFAYIP